jgi:hypothetical protein
MRRAAVLLCVLVMLAACRSSSAEQQPVVRFVCPPFHAWSDADLKALGQALEPIPENSVILRMALDWRRYYGDAKACDGAQQR